MIIDLLLEGNDGIARGIVQDEVFVDANGGTLNSEHDVATNIRDQKTTSGDGGVFPRDDDEFDHIRRAEFPAHNGHRVH